MVELNNFQVNRPFEKKSSRIESITPAGRYKVYDIYESTTDTWLTEGGLVSRGCGEQPLPQNGSCLLGSIDLTQFVTKPFTSEVFFDWGTYTDVIRIFTRMLDNVVAVSYTHLPNGKSPWGTIPPRKFLGFNKVTNEKVIKLIKDHFAE